MHRNTNDWHWKNCCTHTRKMRRHSCSGNDDFKSLALSRFCILKENIRFTVCGHITGGGFYENVPRMLPEGKHAVIKKDSYEVPAIFKMMEREGNVEEHMMYNTYNMGIGMIVAVDPADVEKTMEAMRAAGDTPYVIGEIKDGEKGVTLC